MNLEKAILNRRAIYPKLFSGEEVDAKVIDKMLTLANWAPTHKNTEPWRFKVYSGNSRNRLLDQCKLSYVRESSGAIFNHLKIEELEKRKSSVSHVIAICMKRNAHLLPEFEEIASVAMAVQNMWLYLSSTEKYGGYWSTPAYALGEEFSAFLHLEDEEKCLGLFYVGAIKNEVLLPRGVRGEWNKKVEYYF